MPELLFSFLIGAFCGCRTTVPTAVLCWFAFLGRLPVQGTWCAFLAHPVCVVVMTLAVMGELVVDKLPITPSRLEAPLLVGRMCAGGFTGAVLGTALLQGVWMGALVGASGAVLGALVGYFLRMRCGVWFSLRDLLVALAEDCLTISGAVVVVMVALR
jgi:uncharacterized membrane protein